MSKIIQIIIYIIVSTFVFTQNDTLFFNNEIIPCTVKEITPETVRFSYPKEEIVYSINKNRIQKIVFKNGRVQVFNTSGSVSYMPDSSSELIDYNLFISLIGDKRSFNTTKLKKATYSDERISSFEYIRKLIIESVFNEEGKIMIKGTLYFLKQKHIIKDNKKLKKGNKNLNLFRVISFNESEFILHITDGDVTYDITVEM